METTQTLQKFEALPLQAQGIPTDIAFTDLQVALAGDLSRLTSEGRVKFYAKLCEFTGLNPLSKPFDWLTFQGKLTLYPNKGCAEQLRSLHKVTFDDAYERKVEFGILVMTVRCSEKNGRRDFATAAVPFADNMTPDAKAQAIMKVETKAKRRATFSICGLTMFVRGDGEDEQEVEQVTRTKLADVSSTETASDRAAKLASVVDAEILPEKGSAGSEARGMAEAEASKAQPESATDAQKPTTSTQPSATPAEPTAPQATQTPAKPADVVELAGPDGKLTSQTQENILKVFAQGNPDECLAYLVAKDKIKAGETLGSLDPTAANFIMRVPKRFHQNVKDWAKTQQK